MTISSGSLTKHPAASLREVIRITIPFIFVLFSGSLMGLCDRLILSHFSLGAVEASISAVYLLLLFQMPCIRIASTAQIFVGQYKGAGENKNIGPAVWQMIWFSLFSMMILYPLSWPIGQMFFQNTSIQVEGLSYFRFMMNFNFLFPLGATLSSFYLGQGQGKFVMVASAASHIAHILLDFPLIFGFSNLLPPLGVKGAAISASVAQLLFCAILFRNFLKPLHRQLYNTAHFVFNGPMFWKSLKIGVPRAGSKIMFVAAWAAATHIIIHKQADYLAVLAFGGTINLFYTCFNEGMSQAVTTIGAYLIGSKQQLLWRLARSASLLLGIGATVLAVPFFVFPDMLITIFFKGEPSAILREELYLSCYWLWMLFLMHGFNLIGLGLLNSYGDTLFPMIFAMAISWLAQFAPVYYFIGIYDAPPNRLWLIMAITCLVCALAYFLRLCQAKWKQAMPLPNYQPSKN